MAENASKGAVTTCSPAAQAMPQQGKMAHGLFEHEGLIQLTNLKRKYSLKKEFKHIKALLRKKKVWILYELQGAWRIIQLLV